MSQPFADLVARQGTHNGVKALAVESPDQLVLFALRADDDLDHGKLARELGANPPHRASVRSDRISKLAWSSPA